MKRAIAICLLALPFLVSCAYNIPYHPTNRYEEIENQKAYLDVYPDDVRSNINLYTNVIVGWVGVIQSTDAKDDENSTLINAVTTLDHHYFDWEEDRLVTEQKLIVSPRGEGLIRAEYQMVRHDPEAKAVAAEQFAAPGKLAVIYGTPESLDGDTIVLKYRYMRVYDKNFSTNILDYGRFGQPFKYIGPKVKSARRW